MSTDRTRDNPLAKNGKGVSEFGLGIKISAVIVTLVASFVLAELLLQLMSPFDAPSLMEKLSASGLYSKEELHTDLPHFTERQVANCIFVQSGLHWDPRFGSRRLFGAHKESVVLLGGSAMEDNQAPNYLTTIDRYAFSDDASYASINLAESGARHSDMLARFLYEIVELRPTCAVFLDRFNEFNSIRYGAKPEDDFYWTAGEG